jgi:D-glycero-D-manno-heptose 1,7-bisphosphate phosphatase
LDRDGVLNHVVMNQGNPRSPLSLDEFRVVDDAHEALTSLRNAGYALIVVTNQPDVARGLQERSRIDEMHDLLMRALPLDEVRACFHDNDDGCRCRKPAPGMLLDAARDRGIDLSKAFIVGDREKDIQAGRRAGCRTILLRRPYNDGCDADHYAESLMEAADWILESAMGAREERNAHRD